MLVFIGSTLGERMIDFSCKRFELNEIIKCALGLTKTEVKLFLFLKEEEFYLTTKELADKCQVDLTTAQKAVKKLSTQEIMQKRQENLTGGGYQFVYKMKSKKYVSHIIMEKVQFWVSHVKKELCL